MNLSPLYEVKLIEANRQPRDPKNNQKCFECGTIFYRRGNRKFRGTFRTCSKECKNKQQSKYKFKNRPRTGKTIECKLCGKKRYFPPSAIQAYCSKACYWADEKSNLPRGANHYAFKGGVKYIRHSDLRLRKWQRLIRGKSGRKCAACHRTDGIMHADHILPWADFPDYRYDLSNGQILCKECHAMKTSEENKNRGRNKFLKDEYKWKIYYEFHGDNLWQ